MQNQQPAKQASPRITGRFILQELSARLLALDKGLPFVLKGMTLFPSRFLSEYLHGDRSRFYNPISLFVVTTTLLLFLMNQVDFEPYTAEVYDEGFQLGAQLDDQNAPAEAATAESAQRGVEVFQTMLNEYLMKYYTILSFCAVLVYSLMSWMFFWKRKRLNFAENMVINLYITGYLQVLQIFTFLVLWMAGAAHLGGDVIMIVSLLQLVYTAVVYVLLLRRRWVWNLAKALFLSFWSMLIYGIIITVVWALVFVSTSP